MRRKPFLANHRAMVIGILIVAGVVLFETERTMIAAEASVQVRNKQVIQAAFDAWRSKTSGNVFDLLAPDATWTIIGNSPVSRTYKSRQEFLNVVIKPFDARLSKRLVPTVRAIYADGDMVIALFDGEATARDGKPYKNTYTWYMQMRQGKIVGVIAFFDTIEFTDFWTRVKPL
jgi:ketosteroid isomerase-like protein